LDFLSLVYHVDLIDCEFEILDARQENNDCKTSNLGRPVGFIKVGRPLSTSDIQTAHNKLRQTESQLIQSSLKIANFDSERNEFKQQISEIQQKLRNAEKQLTDLADQLVATKMTLVETQIANEDLQQRAKK